MPSQVFSRCSIFGDCFDVTFVEFMSEAGDEFMRSSVG